MSEETRTFRVDGMHCTSCAMTIDWEVEEVAGVKESKTSYADALTTVSYDPAIATAEAIADAIARAGFRAQVA